MWPLNNTLRNYSIMWPTVWPYTSGPSCGPTTICGSTVVAQCGHTLVANHMAPY